MRGIDEESGEFRGPSRSQQKRDAEAVLELAERLVALPASQLARLDLPDAIAAAVRDTQKIAAHIARKRQLHYLAKLMRREDDELIERWRAALEHDRVQARRETAELHRLEGWRERLLDEGDAALAELLREHPHADRQHLRQLVRNAREERLHNRPLHAYRELFRELRAMFGEHDAGDDDA